MLGRDTIHTAKPSSKYFRMSSILTKKKDGIHHLIEDDFFLK